MPSPDLDPAAHPTWPRALATVTECRYDFGAGRALAFGLPLTRHFRIRFNYFAAGTLHTGEFHAARPIPQGTLFPIAYNPEAPHQNTRASTTPRSPLLLIGIAGSIILSLAWLLVLRSCH